MPPFTGKGYCTELGTNMRRFCNMLATERKLVWKRNAALRNLNKIIAFWYCQFVLWSSTLLTRDCKVFSTKSPFAPCFTGFIHGVVWCRTEGSAQHKNGPVTCWHSRLLRWYPPGGDWDTTTTFPRVGKASCRQSPRVNRGVKGEKKKKIRKRSVVSWCDIQNVKMSGVKPRMPPKQSLALLPREASASGKQPEVLHSSPRCPNSPGPAMVTKEVKYCKLQLASWLSAEHHLMGQAWLDSPRSVSGTSGEKRVTAEAPQSRAISDWLEAVWPEEGMCERLLSRAWRNMTACWRNVCRMPGSGKDTSSECHAGFQLMEELGGCIKWNIQQEFSKALQGNTPDSGNLLPPSYCSWLRPKEKHLAKKKPQTLEKLSKSYSLQNKTLHKLDLHHLIT